MTTTLLNLQTRARERADMTNSQFIGDAELNTYINMGMLELYDLLVQANEDYFTTSTNLTISAGANTAALPASFYKLRGLDYSLNGSYVNVPLFNFQDRNRASSRNIWSSVLGDGRRYRVFADSIMIQDIDNAAGSYRAWYIPALAYLVNTTDTLPASLSKFGWDEYIVLFAAERMLSKEESDTAEVRGQRGELANRITIMATDRQVDQSEQIADVQSNRPLGSSWYDY